MKQPEETVSKASTEKSVVVTNIVIREQLRPEHSVVAVVRCLVRQSMERNCGDVVGADEGNFSISTCGKDLVERADCVDEARLNQVFCNMVSKLP